MDENNCDVIIRCPDSYSITGDIFGNLLHMKTNPGVSFMVAEK